MVAWNRVGAAVTEQMIPQCFAGGDGRPAEQLGRAYKGHGVIKHNSRVSGQRAGWPELSSGQGV